jgi:hypothetical protein
MFLACLAGTVMVVGIVVAMAWQLQRDDAKATTTAECRTAAMNAAWSDGYEAGKEVIRNEAEAVGVGWHRSIKGQRGFKWVPPTEPYYAISWGPNDNSEVTSGGPYLPIDHVARGQPPPPPPFDPIAKGDRQPNGKDSCFIVRGGKDIGVVTKFVEHGVERFQASPLFGVKTTCPQAAWLERETDAAYWLARRYALAKFPWLSSTDDVKPMPDGGPK